MTYDPECDGSYECDAFTHALGCLSHSIDPPNEIELDGYNASVTPPRNLSDALDQAERRDRARRRRNG